MSHRLTSASMQSTRLQNQRRSRSLLRSIPLCLILILLGFGLPPGCSDSKESAQDKHFVDTYVELLVIREQYPDTADANPRVRALMVQEGYTQQSFQEQFTKMAQDAESFRGTIDSARALARLILRGEEEARDAAQSNTDSSAQDADSTNSVSE